MIWRLFVLGIGLGPSQSLFNMVSQSSAPMKQIGVATSTSMFLRQCGGMVGVSIFGAMLLAKMTESITKMNPNAHVNIGEMQRMAMTSQSGGDMPPMMQAFVAKTISDAMSYIFMGSLVIVACAFIAILFIPQIQLRGRGPGSEPGGEKTPEVAPAH